jgi:hypothetical protein
MGRVISSAAVVPLAVGAAFALFAGHIAVGATMHRIRDFDGTGVHNYQTTWHSEGVGYVERALYSAAVLIGKPELVGVWLLVKVAAALAPWTEHERPRGKGAPKARQAYNTFLIGGGLSLMFGLSGGFVALQSDLWDLAVAFMLIGPLAVTAVVQLAYSGPLWLRRRFGTTRPDEVRG